MAVGTGDINAKESASSNGRIVHDSHAVVAARRSLMRLDDTKFLCERSHVNVGSLKLYLHMLGS